MARLQQQGQRLTPREGYEVRPGYGSRLPLLVPSPASDLLLQPRQGQWAVLQNCMRSTGEGHLSMQQQPGMH